MEICGLNVLTSSNARKLFALGKDWIVATWKEKKRDILKIEVLPKLIGRNSGFILDVYVGNPCEKVRYFAKIQSPHIDTVTTHFLLKHINCGPDEFFTALLDHALRYGWWWCEEHGVITRNIETWKMASSWSAEEKLAWVHNGGFLKSFVLTLLIHLGKFGNIPGNRDNWGFVTDSTEVPVSEQMKLVDFSAGGDSSALYSLKNFQKAWAYTLPRCTSSYAFLQSRKQKNEWKDLVEKQSVVEHARQCPWLHSQDTFVSLMRRVCADTAAWLFDTINASIPAPAVEETNNTLKEDIQKPATEYLKGGADVVDQLADLHLGTTSCAAPAAKKDGGAVKKCDKNDNNSISDQNTSPGPLLQAFRNKPMPNVKKCSGTKATMVREYIEWVDQWNDEVSEFCKWFPFPAAVEAQQLLKQGQEKVQMVDGDHGQKQEQTLELCMKDEKMDAVVDAKESDGKVEGEG